LRFFLSFVQTKAKEGKTMHKLKRALRRVYTDFSLRTLVFLYGGGVFNALYALFYIVFSLISDSEMHLVFSLYYTMLAINRLFLIHSYRLAEKSGERDRYRTFRHSGVFVVALGLSLIPLSAFLPSKHRALLYSPLLLFVSLAYTLFSLSFSLRGSLRHGKGGSLILAAAKNVSLAGTFVSLLSLKSALPPTFSFLGVLSVIATLFLGVFMMSYGKAKE